MAANDQFNNRQPSKTDMSYYATKPAASTQQTSAIPKKVGANDFPKTAGSYSRNASESINVDQVGRRAWDFTQNIFRRFGSQSSAMQDPQRRNLEQMRVGGGYGPEYNLYQPPSPLHVNRNHVNRNEFHRETPQVPPAVNPVSTPTIRHQPLAAPVFAPVSLVPSNRDPLITRF